MKKFLLIFTSCVTLSMVVFAKQIIIDISDEDYAIVEMRIVDFEQWLKDLAANKIFNAKEWLVGEEVKRCIREKDSIPANENAIRKQALKKMPNRKQRDELEILKNSPQDAGTPVPN